MNGCTPAVADDIKWMQAALAKAREGLGWTSPRPSVGCVLVLDGEIIGGGHTVPGDGNPHAEVVALSEARESGRSTRGATAYVTLEPCSHFATTPPCTHSLIAAGITRVVAGVRDPNPAIDGRGYEQLREAGIEVVENFLAEECARVHDQFLKHIVQHTPFVTLKCATSLDGKIALASGESQWITSAESRQRTHRLRHEHDAVLVGIETVLGDDPQLNVRLDGYEQNHWKQPARIVLDSHGRIPLESKLVRDQTTPLLVATTPGIAAEKKASLEARGAKVLLCGDTGERVRLAEVLRQAYEHGIFSVLIEGGAGVASSALRENLVDKVVWFVAPILLGAGRDALAEYSLARLAEAPRLRDVQTERIGDDMMWSGYLKG